MFMIYKHFGGITMITNSINLGCRVLNYHLTKTKAPLSLNLRITNRCNFNCSYCDCIKIKRQEMTTEQIKKILLDAKKQGLNKIGFTGGEPLLRKDLAELINYSKQLGLITHIVTNGSLIKNHIPMLKKSDGIFISFDGLPKYQDKNRTKSDVLANIKLALKNGIHVCALTTFTKHNIALENIDYLLKTAKQNGFSVMFQPIIDFDILPENIDGTIFPSKAVLVKAFKFIKKRKKQGYPVADSYTYLNYLIKFYPYSKRGRCYAGELYAIIDCNGDLYPCYVAIEKTKPVNILTKGFKQAFKELRSFPCNGCHFNCHMEMNYLIDLKPDAISNLLRNHI